MKIEIFSKSGLDYRIWQKGAPMPMFVPHRGTLMYECFLYSDEFSTHSELVANLAQNMG